MISRWFTIGMIVTRISPGKPFTVNHTGLGTWARSLVRVRVLASGRLHDQKLDSEQSAEEATLQGIVRDISAKEIDRRMIEPHETFEIVCGAPLTSFELGTHPQVRVNPPRPTIIC